MFEAKKVIVEWLQEDDNRPVKYLTQTIILEKDLHDSETLDLKSNINAYKPIVDILENQVDKTYWFDKGKTKNYKKYLGSFWQIYFLYELNAQKNEITEYYIYKKLAKSTKDPHN